MRFEKKYLLKLSTSAVAALCLLACAPQEPTPKADATPESREIKPLQMVTATPRPKPTATQAPDQANRPAFDQDNPNWEIRYHELYEQNAQTFSAPTIGQSITIELVNGSSKSGILNQLTPTELSLDIGNGVIIYGIEVLSEESAANFFLSAYARNRALAQRIIEYQRWQRMQEAAVPTPFPPLAVQEIDSDSGRQNNSTGAEQDLPTHEPRTSSIPKNEGPTGRVSQVEAYIRNHAAIPHSLQIKTWGKVQPNKSGYMVRVQYSLESAGGFGLSNEDMMFFMDSIGRVYQKAAVK